MRVLIGDEFRESMDGAALFCLYESVMESLACVKEDCIKRAASEQESAVMDYVEYVQFLRKIEAVCNTVFAGKVCLSVDFEKVIDDCRELEDACGLENRTVSWAVSVREQQRRCMQEITSIDDSLKDTLVLCSCVALTDGRGAFLVLEDKLLKLSECHADCEGDEVWEDDEVWEVC